MDKEKRIAAASIANSLFQELTNTKTTRKKRPKLSKTKLKIQRIKTHIKRVEAGKIKYPTDYDKTVLNMLQNQLKKLNKQKKGVINE